MRSTPGRMREAAILAPARDDVPMHVGCHVAQAGKVDFVWVEQVAQCGLDGENDAHYLLRLFAVQVGHFGDVAVQNDAAEAGIIRVVDVDDATKRVFPEKLSPGRRAKLAIGLSLIHI